jgi:hypothetical protein
MAITLVGTDASAGGLTPVTPTYPTGIQSGDIIVVAVASTLGAASTPSGYTLVGGQDDGGGAHIFQYIFAKVAAGTETGTLSIAFSGGGRAVASIHVRRPTYRPFASVAAAMLGISWATPVTAAAITTPRQTAVPAASWLMSFASYSAVGASTGTISGTNWAESIDAESGSAGVFMGLETADNTTDVGTANQCTHTINNTPAHMIGASLYIHDTTVPGGNTAPTIVSPSNTAWTSASASPIDINVPSGSSHIGDILVAIGYTPSRNGNTHTMPAGWLLVRAGTNVSVWVKLVCAGEAEAGTASFAWTGGASAGSVITFLIRSGAGPLGYEILSGQANGASTNITAPSATPSRAVNARMVVAYLTSTNAAIVVPTGQTAWVDGGATGVRGCLGDEVLSNVGAFGTRIATSSSAANETVVMTFTAPVTLGTGPVYGNTTGVLLKVQSWFSGAVTIINPTLPSFLPRCRLLPFWLADTGMSALGGSSGSTNITQLGLAAATDIMLSANVAGVISGFVTISSVPVAGCRVCLFYRPTCEFIKIAITDALGYYEFDGLDETADINHDYFAVAIDPNGLGTQYNSLIWDRLTTSQPL